MSGKAREAVEEACIKVANCEFISIVGNQMWGERQPKQLSGRSYLSYGMVAGFLNVARMAQKKMRCIKCLESHFFVSYILLIVLTER